MFGVCCLIISVREQGVVTVHLSTQPLETCIGLELKLIYKSNTYPPYYDPLSIKHCVLAWSQNWDENQIATTIMTILFSHSSSFVEVNTQITPKQQNKQGHWELFFKHVVIYSHSHLFFGLNSDAAITESVAEEVSLKGNLELSLIGYRTF